VTSSKNHTDIPDTHPRAGALGPDHHAQPAGSPPAIFLSCSTRRERTRPASTFEQTARSCLHTSPAVGRLSGASSKQLAASLAMASSGPDDAQREMKSALALTSEMSAPVISSASTRPYMNTSEANVENPSFNAVASRGCQQLGEPDDSHESLPAPPARSP